MERRIANAGFGVIIVKNNKILMGRRHDDVDKADSAFRVSGCWTMPGGKLEFGEGLTNAGKREVLEETGIVVTKIRVFCINNEKNEHAHFLTAGLVAEEFEGEAQVMEPNEITEWRWFDINNLPENIYLCSQSSIKCFLENKLCIKD